MFNYSVILTVIVSVFLYNKCVLTQSNPTNPPLVQECLAAEKLTDQDFINLKRNVQPWTEEMKCLTACLFEKSERIVSNKLNTETILASVKTLPNYSTQLEQNVTAIMNDCVNIQDPDRCQVAFKIMDCLMIGCKERGVTPKVFYPHH